MGKGRFTNLELDGPKGGSKPGNVNKSLSGKVRRTGAEIRDVQYYMRQALKYEMAGFHEQALRAYSAALGENPLFLDAWVGQLLMLVQLEEYSETRLWADKALEKFPDNPCILAVKSVAVYRMGFHNEAKNYCDLAVRAKGESEIVWLCRGELMLIGSHPTSEACFRKALNTSKNKSVIHLRIGEVYLRYRKYSLALISLQHASSSMPNAAWAWYLLGTAQEKLGLFSQAQISFKQAVAANPRNEMFRKAAAGKKQPVSNRMAAFLRRVFGK